LSSPPPANTVQANRKAISQAMANKSFFFLSLFAKNVPGSKFANNFVAMSHVFLSKKSA
jgi:hypothetical protein